MIEREHADSEKVLPMPEQVPFGMPSESPEWYQHTFEYAGRSETVDDGKKAMIVMAHPDDESEMAGGLIALLAEKGFQVTVVHMTDGRKGGDSRHPMTDQELVNLRLEEAYQAAYTLGVHRFINLGAIDGELPMDPVDDPRLVEKLTKVMRQEGGSFYVTHPLLFNPTTFDYHVDHRHTSTIVERAIQLARNGNHALQLGEPLNNEPTVLYVDPQNLKSAIALSPKDAGKSAPVSFLLDVTRVHDRKMKAFEFHSSQVNNLPDGATKNYVAQRSDQDAFRARQMRSLIPYGFRRKNKVYAEGYGLHLAHGFNTNLSGVFSKSEMVLPKRFLGPRRLPDFTR